MEYFSLKNHEKSIEKGPDMDILKTHLQELSNCLDAISPDDIEDLRQMDKDVDRWITNITDMLGNSNPYWRVHPLIPNIRCSIMGEIEISGHRAPIREYSGKLKVFYAEKNRKLSAPDLIMACFKPCPEGERSRYKISYYDRDPQNIKPSNMFWERL